MESDLIAIYAIFFIIILMLIVSIAYRLGKLHGAKEYYNLLTSTKEQENIK